MTCVCPTYGRYSRLRDALSCFLHQSYPHKKLFILNDAPIPIQCPFDQVTVFNAGDRVASLGRKRQWLLEAADSSVIAHWDDDDLYLPWHLEEGVAEMRRQDDEGMVKPKRAWRIYGKTPEEYELRPPNANRYEGQLIFSRETALRLGGYTIAWSGQCKPLMAAMNTAGLYHAYHPVPGPSYVYRWNSGVAHISSRGNTLKSHDVFASKNQDFGDGSFLLPRPLRDYAGVLSEKGPEHLPEEHREAFLEKARCWYENTPTSSAPVQKRPH